MYFTPTFYKQSDLHLCSPEHLGNASQKDKVNIIHRLFQTGVSNKLLSLHILLYIICRICNKCICSKSTGSLMSYDQWHNSYTSFFFFHLGIILILVLGFYSGLSGRVRTMCLRSLCVVSLLSSGFIVSALVEFSNFHKYLVLHWALCSFVDLHGSCGCLCTKDLISCT
jgi:hypothetical protein